MIYVRDFSACANQKVAEKKINGFSIGSLGPGSSQTAATCMLYNYTQIICLKNKWFNF